MKYLYTFALLLLLGLSACKKDPVNSDYDKSYAAWQSFKKTAHNSYSYISYGGSVFGYHSETKITVQNGNIISREYVSGQYKSNTDSLVVNTSWTETGSTLNTHGNSGYYLTLDQVYGQAKNVWLNVDAQKNNIYFTVDGAGLISSAGSVEKGCQDDCFIGINIKDIKVYVKEIK